MKKFNKGFTLIEIIICISLIVVIGLGSFIAVKQGAKSVKNKRLNQITDKVLLAAQVYIETNKETYNQLYNKENSVVIPLNVLVNDGLLTLEDTDLKSEQIEDEYIIATLANGGSGDADCVDITTNASWNLSKENPIYICNNKSSGTNSIIIGGTNSNIDTVKVQEEVTESDGIYRFSGGDNYITYNGKTNRIILVDRDDSLVIGTTESTFGSIFNGKTQKYSSASGHKYLNVVPAVSNLANSFSLRSEKYYTDSSCRNAIFDDNTYAYLGGLPVDGRNYRAELIIYDKNTEVKNGEVSLSIYDISALDLTIKKLTNKEYNPATNTSEHFYRGALYEKSSYGYCVRDQGRYSGSTVDVIYDVYKLGTIESAKKIKLKSCMKITGGTGTEVNPYEISDLC